MLHCQDNAFEHAFDWPFKEPARQLSQTKQLEPQMNTDEYR
jgi:hypothetical protein